MPYVATQTCWKARSPPIYRRRSCWRGRRGGTRGGAATTSAGRPNGKPVSAYVFILYVYMYSSVIVLVLSKSVIYFFNFFFIIFIIIILFARAARYWNGDELNDSDESHLWKYRDASFYVGRTIFKRVLPSICRNRYRREDSEKNHPNRVFKSRSGSGFSVGSILLYTFLISAFSHTDNFLKLELILYLC